MEAIPHTVVHNYKGFQLQGIRHNPPQTSSDNNPAFMKKSRDPAEIGSWFGLTQSLDYVYDEY